MENTARSRSNSLDTAPRLPAQNAKARQKNRPDDESNVRPRSGANNRAVLDAVRRRNAKVGQMDSPREPPRFNLDLKFDSQEAATHCLDALRASLKRRLIERAHDDEQVDVLFTDGEIKFHFGPGATADFKRVVKGIWNAMLVFMSTAGELGASSEQRAELLLAPGCDALFHALETQLRKGAEAFKFEALPGGKIRIADIPPNAIRFARKLAPALADAGYADAAIALIDEVHADALKRADSPREAKAAQTARLRLIHTVLPELIAHGPPAAPLKAGILDKIGIYLDELAASGSEVRERAGFDLRASLVERLRQAGTEPARCLAQMRKLHEAGRMDEQQTGRLLTALFCDATLQGEAFLKDATWAFTELWNLNKESGGKYALFIEQCKKIIQDTKSPEYLKKQEELEAAKKFDQTLNELRTSLAEEGFTFHFPKDKTSGLRFFVGDKARQPYPLKRLLEFGYLVVQSRAVDGLPDALESMCDFFDTPKRRPDEVTQLVALLARVAKRQAQDGRLDDALALLAKARSYGRRSTPETDPHIAQRTALVDKSFLEIFKDCCRPSPIPTRPVRLGDLVERMFGSAIGQAAAADLASRVFLLAALATTCAKEGRIDDALAILANAHSYLAETPAHERDERLFIQQADRLDNCYGTLFALCCNIVPATSQSQQDALNVLEHLWLTRSLAAVPRFSSSDAALHHLLKRCGPDGAIRMSDDVRNDLFLIHVRGNQCHDAAGLAEKFSRGKWLSSTLSQDCMKVINHDALLLLARIPGLTQPGSLFESLGVTTLLLCAERAAALAKMEPAALRDACRQQLIEELPKHLANLKTDTNVGLSECAKAFQILASGCSGRELKSLHALLDHFGKQSELAHQQADRVRNFAKYRDALHNRDARTVRAKHALNRMHIFKAISVSPIECMSLALDTIEVLMDRYPELVPEAWTDIRLYAEMHSGLHERTVAAMTKLLPILRAKEVLRPQDEYLAESVFLMYAIQKGERSPEWLHVMNDVVLKMAGAMPYHADTIQLIYRNLALANLQQRDLHHARIWLEHIAKTDGRIAGPDADILIEALPPVAHGDSGRLMADIFMLIGELSKPR